MKHDPAWGIMNQDLKPAIFLDRDGTIIYDAGFLTRPDQLKFLPGMSEALRSLQAQGFVLVVITNQSGVGRGLIQPEELENVHYGQGGLIDLLKKEAIEILDIYFCPHHPTEAIGEYCITCECRKPAPGMILEAAQKHHLDLAQSWMIGDRMRDVLCGLNAGTRGIHLLLDEKLKAVQKDRPGQSESTYLHTVDSCVLDLKASPTPYFNQETSYFKVHTWQDALKVISQDNMNSV